MTLPTIDAVRAKRLIDDGAVVGILSASRRTVRAFSERHISLVQAFAAQALSVTQEMGWDPQEFLEYTASPAALLRERASFSRARRAGVLRGAASAAAAGALARPIRMRLLPRSAQ